ncbi:hypothetical protein FDH38_gp108 [Dinoroseobacter phage vB_DshS-R5C]|uniref:Uncharacterized protein n=1 Tax=Dinoroseobacter phage vB_DshS-R5C TaxID=1965368 RepID=A0A1V0DYC5_9CAUD|nr:hypothetical protein FDH38_gp108 [Dinoroseobacter phage vB_DshS-R5C]ARB06162.1 hypothetical protein vBDshSR5C_108 [Dinoroseobacter phage vB_DshS-R5C]
MLGADEMMAPLVLAQVRDGLEALGYSLDRTSIEGDAIHVRLKNGRTASADIPQVVDLNEVAADITAELDARLQGRV